MPTIEENPTGCQQRPPLNVKTRQKHSKKKEIDRNRDRNRVRNRVREKERKREKEDNPINITQLHISNESHCWRQIMIRDQKKFINKCTRMKRKFFFSFIKSNRVTTFSFEKKEKPILLEKKRWRLSLKNISLEKKGKQKKKNRISNGVTFWY